jgi:hypothetical protein
MNAVETKLDTEATTINIFLPIFVLKSCMG